VSLAEALPRQRALRIGLLAAGVVAVVATLVLGGWFWYRSQESRGLVALAEASNLAQQAQAPGATVEARERAIKALEAVVAGHPRLSAAGQAAYQLGNLRYAAGQYPAARGAYEAALAKGASGTVRTLAALGIGYTWESENSYDRASSAYEAAARSIGSKDFLYEESMMDLARAQELGGKPSAALDTYKRLLKEVPGTRRGSEIQSRVASLQSRPAK
jgi:tetratricopeptide (TPR) repeat protein